MLVELSVMEQRYHAVLEVITSLVPVSEVAERYGVSRQTVHAWVARYEAEGLPGLADHSHRPRHHPWQLDAEVEALICQLRRAHHRWGPRRLRHELGRKGVEPLPSRSTVYRVLVREHLVEARPRKRRRDSYRRWERPAPMDLWQLDITGSVFLANGTEIKVITGEDDHSRYCVIAKVARRGTSRALCQAFAEALVEYGCPDQVLTDNGKQFSGKFNRPRPTEVLFDQICRRNGIEHLLTAIRHPTTTGKLERWHQTLQRECLEEHDPPADLAAAQAMVDAFRDEYNHRRPHQSLDMATPATRFRPIPEDQRVVLPLWLPAHLRPVDGVVPDQQACEGPGRGQGRSDEGRSTLTPPADPRLKPVAGTNPEAIEVDRVVPVSGNLAVRPQQFWLGTARAGQTVRLWIDTTTVHLSIDGIRIKTLPSRYSVIDLARLRRTGARAAGPPPAPPLRRCWPPALPWSATAPSPPAGWSHWAGGGCQSVSRWPGNGSPCDWRNTWCTSSPTASCGAPPPPRCRRRLEDACAAPGSPDHPRSRLRGRCGCSAGCLVAAAFRSAANASTSACRTPATPSPSRSTTPPSASSTSTRRCWRWCPAPTPRR